MSLENEQLNNPLHGLKLDTLLNELVDHYGWEILAEYTNINCFKNKPSLISSLKFLRKTEWAREKMERFYLYNYKNLPKADDIQYEIPPRKRIIPAYQKPKEPVVLILGQAPPPKVRSNDSFSGNSRGPSKSNSRSSGRDSYQSKNKSRSKPTSSQSNQNDDSANPPFDPYGSSPK